MAKYTKSKSDDKATPSKSELEKISKARKEISKYRNMALRQNKGDKRRNSILNAGLSDLNQKGYIRQAVAKTRGPQQKARILLETCGIDTRLIGISKNYKNPNFSLLKEETGTKILHDIDDVIPQYKDLEKKMKSLDVKKISLEDAIRILDDRKSDTEEAMHKFINYSGNNEHDFVQFARALVSINEAPAGQCLKYFRDYSSDLDSRFCVYYYADKRKITPGRKKTDVGVN